MEKPLFRNAASDPLRSVSVAALGLQSGFSAFAITAPQVARRQDARSLHAAGYERRTISRTAEPDTG